jgi:molybdate transport system regulatory protein
MSLKRRKKGADSKVEGRVWVDKAGEAFLGHGRIELLRAIDIYGSISAAAREMGMSYKSAWQAVDAMNNLADRPLVERSTGGRHGGGTALTAEGRHTVEMFGKVEEEYNRFLARLSEGFADFARFNQLMRRFSMKTSARNQFLGTVTRVTRGAVNGEVALDIGDGLHIVSIITSESLEDLKLKKGREAYALVKASAPILMLEEDSARSSARNRLCGTVVSCIEGAVNGEVGLELPGGKRLTAIITNESIKSLGLKEGVKACALIKASNVILAVND